MIGKVIGNYKISEFIEEGGMGTIYKGTHIKLERAVAVKKLHQNLTSNPQFKERFLNEAKILAKLSHPNIINIYDFIEDEGQFYIFAEFVEGKPLDYMISNNMLSSTQQKIQLFKQILKGIGYAHINGVVHRDIKPSNVMIQNDETAKILDFGIAKLSEANRSLTKTGTKMGSVYYMSPEQVLGKNIDARTDIYSLGVLLFEMLTNRLPYNTHTESDFELMNSIVSQEMPYINNLVSGLAPNLGNVIKKACAKDLNERFSTCEEFSAALDAESYTFVEKNTDYGKTHFIPPDSGRNVSQKTVFIQQRQNTDDVPLLDNQNSKKNVILVLSGFLIIMIIGFLIYFLTSNDIDSELTSRSEENSSEKSTGTNSNSESNSTSSANSDNNGNKKNKNLQNQNNKYINEESLKSEVQNSIINWLDCWQNKNLNCYSSYLSSDYMFESSTSKDKYQDYETRIKKQIQYFKERDYISINYDNMQVYLLSPNEAKVTYNQIYYSPQFSDSGFKVVYLRKHDNKWYIYKDTFF